jgi:hypothetical protein
VVAVDLDSSHQGSDQRLLASPIQIVQPIPHPGGELFEATDHQGQLTLGFGFVHSRLALLFEPDPAHFQARDARLELIRLTHALSITVDQAPYSALKTRDLALQLQHILGSIGVSLRLRQAPAMRRKRVLKGASPEQIVQRRVAAEPKLANRRAKPPIQTCCPKPSRSSLMPRRSRIQTRGLVAPGHGSSLRVGPPLDARAGRPPPDPSLQACSRGRACAAQPWRAQSKWLTEPPCWAVPYRLP